ncbi:MAG: ABC transporter permease subunit [Firmicutes bacterium]|nr:ABC transporter permease subunit [Bacillota bacterium]
MQTQTIPQKLKTCLESMLNNPIVHREIKQTFRKPKIFWIFAVYLFLLAGAAFYIFGIAMTMSGITDGFDPKSSSIMYLVILGIQLLVMTLVAPISTSTAISGEKERQTFDLLIITKTSMYDIILGKLLSSLMIVGIMLVLSMPVYAVVFYYGGVSIGKFIMNMFYLISYVAMVGSLGIAFSTVMKKSAAASIATVLLIFAMTIGIWIALGMVMAFVASATYSLHDFEPWRIIGQLFMFNPIVSFISIVDSHLGSDVSWELLEEIGFSFENKYIYCWHINMILHFIVAHLLIRFSAKRIAPIRKK